MKAPIRALTSLAILKADLDDGRRDYLTYLETLAAPVLGSWGNRPVADGLVAAEVFKEYGLRVPDRAMQLVLRRLAKRGYLKREEGAFHVVKPLPDLNLATRRSEAERQISAVCLALVAHAKNAHSLELSESEALDALLVFLGQFGVECLRAYVFRTAIEAPDRAAPRHLFVVGDFVRNAYEAGDPIFDSVIVLVKGQMFSNALTCPDLEGIEKNFKGVTFYLDTPLVLTLLRVQGIEDFDAVAELVRLLQQLKGEVAIFEHTVVELESVLKAAADNLENPEALGRVVREIRRAGLRRGDVLMKLSSFENELKTYGVKIRKTPAYDEAFQISETELETAIRQQVNYRNPKALEFDINSIRSIFALRKGAIPRRLEDSQAVLVTSNSALARAAYEVGKNHNSAKEVSVAITDFSLGNVAWLKSPMDAPALPMKETLAAAYAALEPDPGLWAKYLNVIDDLRSKGAISADDHAVLRISGLAERELMELTLGAESSLSGNSVSEILTRVREALSRDKEQEVQAEKTAHRETHEKLLSANRRQERLRQRVETVCSGLVWGAFLIVGSIFAATLFVGMLLASGITGNFIGNSKIATAVANSLVVIGVLWSVFAAVTGQSLWTLTAARKRVVSRRLASWTMGRILGVRDDAA